MLLVLLLVLAFVPRITVSVPHRCFSTSCSSRVCIRVCQTNEPYCHVRFSPNNIRQLIATDIGCGNTSQSLPDVSTDHSIPTFPIPEYSCKGDLCNRVDGLTDSIQPLLEIPLNLPKDPLPQPHKGFQVCERYNCSSDGDCRADYEYCSVTLPTTGYCRAEYIVNATTMKIELYSKGCLQIQYENLFNISSECHIDNHLDSPAGAVLVCTCNGSLCNQNITFTHPTRHAKYGASDCQQRNCSHVCEIVVNKPICQCPTGFHTGLDNRTCEDINECSTDNGGCDTFCINTIGSYYCNCTSDRYLSHDGKTCKVKEGLVCSRQRCSQDGQCGPTFDEYCFDTVSEELQGDRTYCAASYIYSGSQWIPQWKHCFVFAGTPFISCNSTLQKTLPDHSFYMLCCKSNHCNDDNNIDFPFFPPTSTTIFSSTVIPTATSLSNVTIATAARPDIHSVSPSTSSLSNVTIITPDHPNNSISIPELVAFVTSCVVITTMLTILPILLLSWYVYKRSSSNKKYKPRSALENEDSPHEKMQYQMENPAGRSQQVDRMIELQVIHERGQ